MSERSTTEEINGHEGLEAIVMVGSAKHGEPHVAYTVGGPASLVVTGLVLEAKQALLMAHHLRLMGDDGVGFVPPFEPRGMMAMFVPVPDRKFRSLCLHAVAYGAVRARQFVWQSDEKLWPWDAGYPYVGGVVLAGPDWRPTS